MKRRELVALALVICLALVGWSSPDESKSANAAKSMAIPELRDHIFFLAADELEGRSPESQGYRIAALYGVTQFRAAGLKPIIENSDGDLSYMQPLAMKKNYKSEYNQIVVKNGDTSTTLEHVSDYALFTTGIEKKRTLEGLDVVFAGYGISEPEAGWDDYDGLDVKGRMVIIEAGSPLDKDGSHVLPEEVNDKYKDLQMGLIPKGRTANSKEAAGVLIVPFEISKVVPWDRILASVASSAIFPADGGDSPFDDIQAFFILANVKAINSILADAQYNPVAGKGDYSTFAVEGVSVDLRMEDVTEYFTSHNIVGMVEGTDPDLKDEYISISAHLDHLGIMDGETHNGADDNASGCAAVIELAKAIVMNPPRRSVVFILFSGKEYGRIGSNVFLSDCPVPVENIVLSINLDAVGRDTEEALGGVFAMGSGRRSSQLKQIVIDTGERIEGLNVDFSLDENDPTRRFDRTDQFYFDYCKIPGVLFTTGEHPQYHEPGDDTELIDFTKLQKIARLSYDVAMTVGNLDDRLKQDVETK